MASPKKLRLLSSAVSFLPVSEDECYLEIGTYQGKSLVSALLKNPGRHAVACDNFSLFDKPGAPRNRAALDRNLARYGLSSRIRFFDCDFRDLLSGWRGRRLPLVGVYFYDGAHDEESQYLAIRLAEDVLAERAIIIVDDWRFAEDSDSRAEAGTRRALADSAHDWKIEHILPARYNGDLDQWWNGVAVLSFRRVTTTT
jgi:predicted O-methyltransferase YrrM